MAANVDISDHKGTPKHFQVIVWSLKTKEANQIAEICLTFFEKKSQVCTVYCFINTSMLKHLNGVSNRYFLSHIYRLSRLMHLNMLRQILLNTKYSRLQSRSRNLKFNVMVISKTGCTIFE